MKAGLAKLATACVATALLAGCAGIREHRGTVIDTELVSSVQVGVDNKDSVQRVLGRPSFAGAFSDNDWYYVSQNTKAVAFANPHVTKQTVLHISFDQAGNVIGIQETGKELIAKINPVDDITPTLGRKKTLLDEIFSNIGSVNSGGMGTPPPEGE
jgi:outer membrane protein assembly factor BamE (lipoprotein component of BamABCDE complex)